MLWVFFCYNYIMKFCIFCGETPNNKNKEHVLPQWLIKLTGNPKRVVNFGDNINEDIKTFDWTSFTFPSCTFCNSKWGLLESKIQPLIKKLFILDELNKEETFLLLDWMDKVRIGLWLGYYYLFKNTEGIKPQFFINDRVASQDRLLNIHVLNKSASDGINAFGIETPIFKRQPSCFGLRINNILLVSVSDNFLVSEFCSFTPYPKKISISKNGLYSLSDFIYKKENANLKLDMHVGQISIAQPIHTKFKTLDWYHSTDILNNNYISFEDKIGDIYTYRKNYYKFNSNNRIKYQEIFPENRLNIKDLIIEIYQIQIKLYFKNGIESLQDKQTLKYLKDFNKIQIQGVESIDY